eukprot:6172250-Pyramimonas_sp.AAC.1
MGVVFSGLRSPHPSLQTATIGANSPGAGITRIRLGASPKGRTIGAPGWMCCPPLGHSPTLSP